MVIARVSTRALVTMTRRGSSGGQGWCTLGRRQQQPRQTAIPIAGGVAAHLTSSRGVHMISHHGGSAR